MFIINSIGQWKCHVTALTQTNETVIALVILLNKETALQQVDRHIFGLTITCMQILRT